MSWQGYIDNLALHSQDSFYAGAICGIDGSVWATSSGFQTTQAEIVNIAKTLQGELTPEESSLQQNGVFVSGQKYRFIVKIDAGNGAESLPVLNFALAKGEDKLVGCAALTKQAVVVCLCYDKGSGNKAVKACSTVALHLKSSDM